MCTTVPTACINNPRPCGKKMAFIPQAWPGAGGRGRGTDEKLGGRAVRGRVCALVLEAKVPIRRVSGGECRWTRGHDVGVGCGSESGESSGRRLQE